ncbi:unnamed protein product [Linum tenue]|uniref:Leucine-rich repeat-containing N-terminal plant-type domain-containing protein n=1 Tax=Linum tenue TaxID=586396 RepID=A0AAV0HUU2_9ROSI|nr:unnamed protein product [Linum tenue]
MSAGGSKARYGWFIWAVALFTVAEWKSCNGCWERERIGLLRIKASLNNPPYISSWSGTGTNSSDDDDDDCCNWYGVGCDFDTGKVTELMLDPGYPYNSDFNLPAKRDINASLFLPFQDLRELSLRGYHIPGCVENQG